MYPLYYIIESLSIGKIFISMDTSPDCCLNFEFSVVVEIGLEGSGLAT